MSFACKHCQDRYSLGLCAGFFLNNIDRTPSSFSIRGFHAGSASVSSLLEYGWLDEWLGAHARTSFDALLYRLQEPVKSFLYSQDGSHLAVLTSKGILMYSMETLTFAGEIETANALEMSFSPLSKHISVYSRLGSNGINSQPTSPLLSPGMKNCFIYKVDDCQKVFSFQHRNQSSWHVQWSADEKYFARLASSISEVQIYSLDDLKAPKYKYSCEGLSSFSLSPSVHPIKMAAFICGKNGATSSVKVFNLPDLETPVCLKSFFKADRVNLYWNYLGQNLITLTHTEVDGTGKSYYGENNLVYMSGDGSFDCNIKPSKEGPIHDLVWSPKANEFIVVYGFMPAKATLFDGRCNPIFEFGTGSKNFVRYNPFGNIICLAGFGNLAGDIELWDRDTLKRFSFFQAGGTTICEWCPDGQHLLLATLSPRLRVDNGYKIYHYNGSLVLQEPFKELNQIDWQPQSASAFTAFKLDMRALSASTNASSKAKTAYVPPSLRGRSEVKLPVGLDPSSVKAFSIKKKPPVVAARLPPPVKIDGEPKAQIHTCVDDALLSVVEALPKLSATDKLVKNISKKLDQIRLLKAKKEAGISLEDNQIEKIAKEVELLKELNSLKIDTS